MIEEAEKISTEETQEEILEQEVAENEKLQVLNAQIRSLRNEIDAFNVAVATLVSIMTDIHDIPAHSIRVTETAT